VPRSGGGCAGAAVAASSGDSESEALVNEGVSTHWTMARVRVTRCGVAAEERLDSDASLFSSLCRPPRTDATLTSCESVWRVLPLS
jgi:cobalamin biosynthesis Mg chelatase CobN